MFACFLYRQGHQEQGDQTQNTWPQVSSLNAAILACEKGGQWQQAMALLHKMRDIGMAANACDQIRCSHLSV